MAKIGYAYTKKQVISLVKVFLHFNYDETGVPLNPMSVKTIDKVGSIITRVAEVVNQKVLPWCDLCVAGYAIPPLIIFDQISLSKAMTRGEVPGTFYGQSLVMVQSRKSEIYVYCIM